MFKNLKLAYKLGIAFSITATLSVAMGITSLYQLKLLSTASDEIEHNSLPSVYLASKIALDLSSVRRLEALLIVSSDKKEVASLFERIVKFRTSVEEKVSEYQKTLVASPEDKAAIDELAESTQAYFESHKKFLEERAKPEYTPEIGNEYLFGPSRKIYVATGPKMDALFKVNRAYADNQGKEIEQVKATAITVVIGASIVNVLLSIFLAIAIRRSVATPLETAVKAADEIAGGNLSTDISSDRTDEIGHLISSLSAMRKKLAVLVGGVRDGSEAVAVAATEIAQGNNDLSARTENQASALEQTAASMEELASTVKQNADAAREASKLAGSVSVIAIKGGATVAMAVETMEKINDSSKKIAEIISVIDGIAFQTNILALNAAVEAARAGEQGRGFAVVATEVRSLAGRSATAAKDIKTLIENSVVQVTAGTEQVNSAGQQMADVVASVNKVAHLMQEISVASDEQASSVAQVGEAVNQMDQVTQQNAALVEQMAAAASGLKNQATETVKLVSTFRL